MNKCTFLFLFVIASCSSPITKKDATSSFIIETNLSKDQAYSGTLAYLAKNLGKSNEAIQLKDQSTGKIISKVGIDCNELRAFADITNYTVIYTLEADFKDKKGRLNFEGNSFSQINIDGNPITVGAELKEHQKDGVAKCAAKIKSSIVESLKNIASSNW